MLGPAGYLILGSLALLGARLIALSLQTRKLPELWIGLFFVLTAPGALTLLRGLEVRAQGHDAHLLAAVGLSLVALGTIPVYIFTCTVFRSGERWAQALAIAGSLLVLWGGYSQIGGFSLHIDTSRPRLDFVLGRLCCFGWATYESLRLYSMMRRRIAVGLGDLVIGNRFLLFALWSAAMGVLPILHTLDRLVGDSHSYLRLLTMLPKFVGACTFLAIGLNFFPPRAYLRWLRRGETTEASQ